MPANPVFYVVFCSVVVTLIVLFIIIVLVRRRKKRQKSLVNIQAQPVEYLHNSKQDAKTSKNELLKDEKHIDNFYNETVEDLRECIMGNGFDSDETGQQYGDY